MPIKGEEAATERGLGNIKRKKKLKNKRERITEVRETLFIFAFWLTSGTSGKEFIYRRIIRISSYLNNQVFRSLCVEFLPYVLDK